MTPTEAKRCRKCQSEVEEVRIVEDYEAGNLPERRLLNRRYVAEPCGDELTFDEYCIAIVANLTKELP